MDISIELGQANDIDELEQLYNDLNDYLAKGVNYPGWIKGIYPIRQNAIDGVINGNLYVAKHNGKIIGSIICYWQVFLEKFRQIILLNFSQLDIKIMTFCVLVYNSCQTY